MIIKFLNRFLFDINWFDIGDARRRLQEICVSLTITFHEHEALSTKSDSLRSYDFVLQYKLEELTNAS